MFRVFLNISAFILNMNGLILNMTGLVLNMIETILKVTGFDSLFDHMGPAQSDLLV